MASFRHHPRARFVGEIEDPDPPYASAKVVIIPMRLGTGVSIKMLQTMARGRAFVASQPAFRGLDPGQTDREGFVAPRDPRRFAENILELLADPRRRAEVAAAVFVFAVKHFSKAGYFRKWDELLAALHGTSPPPEAPIPGFRYTEWTAEERLLARAVKHVLIGDPCSQEDGADFARSWLSSSAARRELSNRILKLKDAPLTNRRPDLRRAVSELGPDEIRDRLSRLDITRHGSAAG
jgi:hypothetical protein